MMTLSEIERIAGGGPLRPSDDLEIASAIADLAGDLTDDQRDADVDDAVKLALNTTALLKRDGQQRPAFIRKMGELAKRMTRQVEVAEARRVYHDPPLDNPQAGPDDVAQSIDQRIEACNRRILERAVRRQGLSFITIYRKDNPMTTSTVSDIADVHAEREKARERQRAEYVQLLLKPERAKPERFALAALCDELGITPERAEADFAFLCEHARMVEHERAAQAALEEFCGDAEAVHGAVMAARGKLAEAEKRQRAFALELSARERGASWALDKLHDLERRNPDLIRALKAVESEK